MGDKWPCLSFVTLSRPGELQGMQNMGLGMGNSISSGSPAPCRVPPTAPVWVRTGAEETQVQVTRPPPKNPAPAWCQSSVGWMGQFGDVPIWQENIIPKAGLERGPCPSLHPCHLVLSPACQTSPVAVSTCPRPGWTRGLEQPGTVECVPVECVPAHGRGQNEMVFRSLPAPSIP